MQHLFITSEKTKALKKDKNALQSIEAASRCKIQLQKDDVIAIDGDAYAEMVAKNMLNAYSRGFDLSAVLLLSGDDYYFSAIDLKNHFNTEKRIQQIKARLIGKEGKTRNYIESVSNAKISVSGNTIGIIGTSNAVHEAEVALYALIEGSNHRTAYYKMEAAHRKNKHWFNADMG